MMMMVFVFMFTLYPMGEHMSRTLLNYFQS